MLVHYSIPTTEQEHQDFPARLPTLRTQEQPSPYWDVPRNGASTFTLLLRSYCSDLGWGGVLNDPMNVQFSLQMCSWGNAGLGRCDRYWHFSSPPLTGTASPPPTPPLPVFSWPSGRSSPEKFIPLQRWFGCIPGRVCASYCAPILLGL